MVRKRVWRAGESSAGLLSGPIAVGGLGGSGTRLVWAMLTALGVSMGVHPNHAGDDLLFTALLKRPRLARPEYREEVHDLLRTYESLAVGRPTPDACRRLVHAILDPNHGYLGRRGRIRLLGQLTKSVRRAKPAELWGFKEPNSHLYLEHMADVFSDLRYVHVVRHGLDMALSNNIRQLQLWGSSLGVDSFGKDPRVAQLDYWIRANEAAVGTMRRRLSPDRYLLLRYDDVITRPAEALRGLASLAQRAYTDATAREVLRIVEAPAVHRYSSMDLGVFRPDQIKSVRAFGFDVD